MRRLFVDTSALIALKDAADEHHGAAVEAFRALLGGPPARLVLTQFVLSEVHGYFCRSPHVALEYVERLLVEPPFQLARASARDEARALAVLRSSRDKSYSYADAVSFAVMERLAIAEAFAFDRHFRQRGLRLFPGA